MAVSYDVMHIMILYIYLHSYGRNTHVLIFVDSPLYVPTYVMQVRVYTYTATGKWKQIWRK